MLVTCTLTKGPLHHIADRNYYLPFMTTGPRTQSSPRWPGPSSSPVAGSTIFACKWDASFPTDPYALDSSGPTVEATEPDDSVKP